MARQIDGIRRMLLIINKIYATNGQYGDSCVSVHELLSYINDHVDAPISERTLQRDINDIEMLFHIEISFDRATNSYRMYLISFSDIFSSVPSIYSIVTLVMTSFLAVQL